MAFLHFPSHRVLTEMNHASNTFPQTIYSQSRLCFTVTRFFPPLPSFLLFLAFPCSPFALLIFPPLALLPVSLRVTRVSLSFDSEGLDERWSEAERGEGACNDPSWLMHLVRKCWRSRKGRPKNRWVWDISGRAHQITCQRTEASGRMRVFIKEIRWVEIQSVF